MRIGSFFETLLHSRLASLLATLCVVIAATNGAVAQAPPGQAAPSKLSASAMEEVPSRMQAVAAAQQSGDVTKIAAANRNLIAVGLRAMAELKLAQGDTKQAIDLYQRSLTFEDTPQTHISLALTYMRAHRIDEALAQIEPVTKSDPNGRRCLERAGQAPDGQEKLR